MADLLLSTARLEIEAAAGSEKPARIEARAYAGGVLPIGGNRYIIALDGLTLPASVPLLRDHDNQVAAIIGSVRAATRDNSLFIEGNLARGTPAADQVIALSQAGVELGISVGVEPETKTYIAPKQKIQANGRTFMADDAGLVLVSKSNLREISVVPVGADRTATARIAASSESKGFQMSTNEDVLSPENIARVNAELRAALPENQPGITVMERIQARWGREKWHNPDAGPRQRAEKAMIAAAGGKITYGDFERELLESRLADSELARIYAERPKGPAIYSSSRDAPGGENLLAAASMLYFGRESLGEKVYGAPAMQRARDLGLRSIHDLGRFALNEKGAGIPHGGAALLKAAFGTTDLPNALGDSAGKIALAAFNEQPATWRSWCAVVPVSDFKTKKLIRVGHAVGLLELSPAGEIAHGTLSETAREVTANTFARMIAIPRQLLINDDLSMIPQVAQDFGKLAMRKVSSLIYTALLANAGSFFSGGNKNIATGAGSALSITSLAAAVKLFRNQTDSDGEPLDVRPAVLLVPPSLEPTARQLLASVELLRVTTDGLPTGNWAQGLNLAPEVEPRLEAAAYTGYSATGWYLLGNPGAQLAVVAFLNGNQGPTVESADTDFDTLGTQWRCYIDVGAALCEPKSGVFSSGTT